MQQAAYVLTPWVAQRGFDAPTIERGEGVYLYDDAGRRYTDLSSGLIAANLGHGNPIVVRAIAEQASRLCFTAPNLNNRKREQLAERLSLLSPWDEGCRTYFTTGGAQAIEDAMKMARMITGRPKICSAYRSFHGSAPGAGTLSGENRRWPNEPGIPGVVRFFAPFPYRSPFDTQDPELECERALAHLELILSYENPQSIAALFIEPVVGSNGVIVYPEGYLAGLRDLCDEHGILLVFDEVMTGFGRTGERFASIRFDVTPDVIAFAKGVTSAYVPLGGVMLRESLAAYFDDHVLGCGHTYSGHPLAVAAGLAALEAYEAAGLYTRGRTLEVWIREELNALAESVPVIGDVRGVGAFFAIELVRDRATREPLVPWQGKPSPIMPRVIKRLQELGVYTFGRYNTLMVAPPLIIERAQLAEAVAALGNALSELLQPVG
jgi:taurine--2-oxoglutarate transaminase